MTSQTKPCVSVETQTEEITDDPDSCLDWVFLSWHFNVKYCIISNLDDCSLFRTHPECPLCRLKVLLTYLDTCVSRQVVTKWHLYSYSNCNSTCNNIQMIMELWCSHVSCALSFAAILVCLCMHMKPGKLSLITRRVPLPALQITALYYTILLCLHAVPPTV